MKLILSVLTFITSFSCLAATISLDQALSNQAETTISPVTVNGVHFDAFSEKHDPAYIDLRAAGICGALDYKRVVKFELESCSEGEKLATFYMPPKSNAYVLNKSSDVCEYSKELRFKSITCAK